MFANKNSLLGMYHELKEAGNTSSWPYLLGNVLYKKLLQKFRAVPSPWRQYAEVGDLPDFKTQDRVILAEAPDLTEVLEDGEYQDFALGEKRYQITGKTYGKQFTISRKAIINDDLKGLMDVPAKLGRAAARTIAKAVVAILEADNAAYDGSSLFATRGASSGGQNFGTTAFANSAAGIAALAAGMAVVRNMKDPSSGQKIGGNPRLLLVPPEKEDDALRATESQAFAPVSTTGGGATNVGVVKRLTVVVEPFLTSSTYCYVIDPDLPFAEVGFVQGNEEPQLLMKAPEVVSVVGGGDDPYGYDIDDMKYKARYEWGISAAYYQGVYRMG